MNSFIEIIKTSFALANPTIEESFEEFKVSAKESRYNIPCKEDLQTIFNTIEDDDSLMVKIGEEGIAAEISNSGEDFKTEFSKFVSQLTAQNEIESETNFYFVVKKRCRNHTINIYDFDAFVRFLSSIEYYHLLLQLNKKIKKYSYINFKLINDYTDTFYSQTLNFYDTIENVNEKNPIEMADERRALIQKREDQCNLIAPENFILTPYDFYLRKRSTNEQVNAIFDKLCHVLLLIYTCDQSKIYFKTHSNNTIFDYKLNGYKSFRYCRKLEDLSGSIEDYYKLFEWMYSSDQFHDKMGLFRNVVSLYASEASFVVSENVYESVQSAHNIYLKKNVDRYIDIKNKVTQHLMDFFLQIDHAVENFSDSFKKTLLGVITYISSIFVIKFVKNDTSEILLTDGLYYFTIVFIIAALLYGFFAFYEFRQTLNRYKEKFDYIKQRYSDLLTQHDIELIFNNNLEFNNNKIKMKQRIVIIFALWVGFLIAVFCVITEYFR